MGTVRSIDTRSVVPYYFQLQEILKEEIGHGRWKPGELIPSESQLASMFGVSRTVIRNALDILEEVGRVYRIKGKGTVVSPPRFGYETIAEAEMWDNVFYRATKTLWKTVDVRRVTAGRDVGRMLDLPPSSEVFELTYAHTVNGLPASVSHTFLRLDASESLRELSAQPDGLPVLEEGGPEFLTQLAELHQVQVHRSEVTVEATTTDHLEGELLDLSQGGLAFLLRSVDFDPEDTPVDLTRTVVRHDQFFFPVVLRHGVDGAVRHRGL